MEQERAGFDSEWAPPVVTEQEKLKWQTKQKQREKLSNAMGQYLLKGYRMLGSNCQLCGNILLRAPRADVDFCIQCEELEKDSTSVSSDQVSHRSDSLITEPTPILSTSLQTVTEKSSALRNYSGNTRTVESEQTLLNKSQNKETSKDHTYVITQSEDTLVSKLAWATKELSATTSVEYSTQLCVLIEKTVNALKSIRDL